MTRKKNNHLKLLKPVHKCPECASNTKTTIETETFKYGVGERQTQLNAEIPVRSCLDCGFQFTDYEAEDIRYETICRHLGRLSPKDLRSIRKQYGLSRKDFSKITLFGEASLARWEAGELLQSGSNDQLLYLLEFEENFRRLLSRNISPQQDQSKNKLESPSRLKETFGALFEGGEALSQLERQAKCFSLHSTC